MNDLRERLHAEVAKVVVGQETGVDQLLVAIAVGGHVLIEGVPGVGKTLLARAFARATGLDFTRIQFTPDMLPSDVVGTMVIRDGELVFRAGPVFTNVLLADEINRTPPKTQSALLEAMGERQVTTDGATRPLPELFLVAATQNPIEYEGTYPLPEAQLDRFLIKLDMGYPAQTDEVSMLQLERSGIEPSTLGDVTPVVTADDLLELRRLVDQTTVSDEVVGYVAALARATRQLPAVEVGASPRSAVHLLAAARAAARLNGRDFVIPDDVIAIAPAVLAHRLVLRPEAEIERYLPRDAIAAAVSTVPVPR